MLNYNAFSNKYLNYELEICFFLEISKIRIHCSAWEVSIKEV